MQDELAELGGLRAVGRRLGMYGDLPLDQRDRHVTCAGLARCEAHRERGAKGMDLAAADADDEGSMRIFGDLEQGFAVFDAHAAAVRTEVHLHASRGIQRQPGAVVQNNQSLFPDASAVGRCTSPVLQDCRPECQGSGEAQRERPSLAGEPDSRPGSSGV